MLCSSTWILFSICQVGVHKSGACEASAMEALGWRVERNIRLQEFVKLEFRLLSRMCKLISLDDTDKLLNKIKIPQRKICESHATRVGRWDI